MIRGEHDTKCPSGWTSLSVSSGRWDKKCFSFRSPLCGWAAGHIPLARWGSWHTCRKGLPVFRDPQPYDIYKLSITFYILLALLCYHHLRTMHFSYINYLICSKRPPVTDLDFKTGSLWSWVSDNRVSFHNAQADVIFPIQCPLHLPIHKSSDHRNLSSKKKSHTHLH